MQQHHRRRPLPDNRERGGRAMVRSSTVIRGPHTPQGSRLLRLALAIGLAVLTFVIGPFPWASASVTPGTQIWVRRTGYAGRSVSVSPDGGTVFVADAN